MELLVILLVLFGGMLYFASRKQKKETQAVQDLQDSLQVGDEVMTTSGMHGIIADLDEDTIDLEVAPDVVTTWNRLAVRGRVVLDDTDDPDEVDDVHDTEHLDGTGDPDVVVAGDRETVTPATEQVSGHENGARPVVERPRLTKD